MVWWDPSAGSWLPPGISGGIGKISRASPTSDSDLGSHFPPGILGRIGRIPPVPLGTSTWRFHDNKYLFKRKVNGGNISGEDKVTKISELYVSLEKVTNNIQNRGQSRIT